MALEGLGGVILAQARIQVEKSMTQGIVLYNEDKLFILPGFWLTPE